MIGVFDSGIGGLSTLAELKRMLPDYDYIYASDSEHATYGSLPQAQLTMAVTGVCQRLYDAGARVIVVACNTATTRFIHVLRHEFQDVIFVGTEPAVKLACDEGYKNILLLATPNTVESRRVQFLAKQNMRDQSITFLPCPNLAHLIETNARVVDLEIESYQANFEDELTVLLNDLFNGWTQNETFDAVVLGCTHYIHVAQQIQSYFPEATLLNGNLGVARRVKNLLELES